MWFLYPWLKAATKSYCLDNYSSLTAKCFSTLHWITREIKCSCITQTLSLIFSFVDHLFEGWKNLLACYEIVQLKVYWRDLHMSLKKSVFGRKDSHPKSLKKLKKT